MARRNDVFAVFHEPVGNNLRNDPDDILSAKKKFKELGYYNQEIENGYIDRPLVDAIGRYQKDRKLIRDGRINPGGQTEATIFSDLLKLPDLDDEQASEGIKVAGPVAPALFALPAIARGGMTAKRAWDVWRAMPHAHKQEALDDACEKAYDQDILECNRIASESERSICYASAMEIYAACLRGRKGDDLPPLYNK
jgi:hypothetical protein